MPTWSLQWLRPCKEHHEKVSIFHLYEFWNGFCFVFEKTSSSLLMWLVILFGHLGKCSN